MEVITCEKLSHLPTLIIEATRLLDDVERGSLSSGTKYNSLLGRWFNKDKKELEKKPVDDEKQK